MANLISKIKGMNKLFHASGCTTHQVKDAQKELGLVFSDEYIDYVKEFGAISFYATEWTGLNVDGYINVVNATKQERKLNPTFPFNYFVVENQGIDGVITASDENGKIFVVQYERIEPLCDSLSEYLDICIARKNKT